MKNILILVILTVFFSCKNQEQKEEKATNQELSNKAGLGKSLIKILDTIHKKDQELRRQIMEIEKIYGRKSDEAKENWKNIAKNDSINLIKVKKILDDYGWLGEDVIGRQGNMTLFLVIQHADLETQQKYLPLMREAVKEGNARMGNLAFLEDRVALGKGNRQIYGSQIGRNQKTGEFYVSPIENPENVDERRAEAGLDSIAKYVMVYDIIWDVEEHKMMTKKLEAEK